MKAYNMLSENDKERIIEEYYDGTKFRMIFQLLNVSERAVSRVLKEAGINTRRRNRYTLNEHYFDTIDCEAKAYILGLLYADGFVGNENFNNIVLSLKYEDTYILERIASLIEYTGDIREENRITNYGEKHCSVINFSSKSMAISLRKIGLYPGKSSTMITLPLIPEELMMHFIRGYFDGDGSICETNYVEHDRRTKGKVRLYNRTNYTFSLLGTIAFLNEMKNKIPANTFFVDCKSDNMIYLTCRSREGLMSIYQYLYQDASIFLTRKFDKWNYIIGALNEKSLS